MDVHSLISLFGQDSGVPLALSDEGALVLAFEAGPSVHLEHDSLHDALQCYVVLGRLPAEAAERHELFRRMLSANVFGLETDGATLGVDEVAGELILSQRLPLAYTDVALLRATLESLVPLAQEWQQQLSVSIAGDKPSLSGVTLSGDPDARVGQRV